MKTGFFGLLLSLLLPTLAAAKTGNDLLGDCSAALKLFNLQNVSVEQDLVKIGDCTGFVSGVMQAAALVRANPGNGPSKQPVAKSCGGPDLSVEQVIRMTVKRLRSKPEELTLDAAVVVLRAMNESITPEPCLVNSGKPPDGLHWPDPPKKARLRVRLVALALAVPRSSYFSSHEVLVAETEVGDEEWSLIKLVFTYLPYQPRLSESGFDYSRVHEVSAWRNPDCDETVDELTTRSTPDRHEPLIYSPHVPRKDLDRRHIPLRCYETKADDYIKSSLEPLPPPPEVMKPRGPILPVPAPR